MFKFLLAGLALTSSALAQQDPSMVIPQLLGSNNIKGGSLKVTPFQLDVWTNASHAIVLFNVSTPFAKMGWAAMGTGTRMSNADMLIVWPNPSSHTFTLSHRTAPSGHAEPETEEASQTGISIVAELSTNSTSEGLSYTQIAILRELVPTYETSSTQAELKNINNQDIVYAYSSTNPQSSSIDATMTRHDAGSFAAVTMDLTQNLVFSPNNEGKTVAPNAQQSKLQWTRHDSLVVIHALCGCIAWLLISPAMVLLGRLGRRIPNWVQIHRLFQVCLTVPLTIAAVVVGSLAVSDVKGAHFTSGHPLLGLFILIILVIQAPLGGYIHHKFNPQRTKRPIRNIFHMVIGLTLTALGFAQVWKGMNLYKLSWQRSAPGYVWAFYYIISITTAIAILISIGRVIQERKMAGNSWKDALIGLGRNTPESKRAYDNSPSSAIKLPLHTLHSNSSSISTVDFDKNGLEMTTIPRLGRTESRDTVNENKGAAI